MRLTFVLLLLPKCQKTGPRNTKKSDIGILNIIQKNGLRKIYLLTKLVHNNGWNVLYKYVL